jgi:hypothetical protein
MPGSIATALATPKCGIAQGASRAKKHGIAGPKRRKAAKTGLYRRSLRSRRAAPARKIKKIREV